MKIALIRGAFLAQYETQIYFPLTKVHEIVAFSSLHPYPHEFPFEVVKLPSPTDINFGSLNRFKFPILNRLFVDAHWLIGLEDKLKGFDIAHCADTFYNYSHQSVIAKRKGYVKAVVATVFENIPFNNEGIWGRRKFKQDVIENTDHFIAISERSKAALILEGCAEKKITVITQHIDTSRFKPKSWNEKNSYNLTILFTGRLEFYKGVYEIIFAAKRLLEDKSLTKYHLNFLMVGRGTEQTKLKELIRRMKIGKCVKILSLPYSRMHEIYHEADIYVAPSRATRTYQEQFSTVLLEAQASGLPIVTTGSGGIPENVEDCALVSNPGDFYSISENIKKFVLNPKLREFYSKRSRNHVVAKFDVHHGAQKVEEVYRKVLEND